MITLEVNAIALRLRANYEGFKNKNEEVKKINGLGSVHIDRIDTASNQASVTSKVFNTSQVVDICDLVLGVINNKYWLTNPSLLSNWTGWHESESFVRSLVELKWDMEKKHIANPEYVFQVGDTVTVGNFSTSLVKEVLWDGLAYIVESTHCERQGKPKQIYQVVEWWNVRPIVPLESLKPVTSLIRADANLRLDYVNTHLMTLLDRIYHFGIDFEPNYQRNFVWSAEDKEKLIYSIFHGVEIGKFVCVKRDFKENPNIRYEILDGKQRLKAIQEYYENKFAYKGYYFNDLCARDKDYFENYPIVTADLKGLTQAEKYRLFIMLNTSGHVMSNNDIEKVKELYKQETGQSFD